jgi:tetratricopeptide (TPR) repeat protein
VKLNMSKGNELKEQGLKLHQQHDYEAAARLFQQAQEAYQAEGAEDMSAEMMVNIGVIHRTLGENQQALDAMQTAMRVFKDMQDQERIAKVLGNMGGVYTALGDKEQAYTAYREAADIFEELNDKQNYGETLVAMGYLLIGNGKWFAGATTIGEGLTYKESLSTNERIMKGLASVIGRVQGTSANVGEDK